MKKSFGSFEALKGINIHVAKNDVYGFLGHNGSGKSTTINIMAGLSRMDGGTCRIDGQLQDSRTSIIHPNIGYLPEEPKFYPWMTAYEYLQYIGSAYSGKVSCRIEEILEWVGLNHATKRRIGGFSRGMKQRLGMAVALFYDPDILLLDEPSSALDPQGRADVLDMIKRLKDAGKTVFLSTHILDDVERVCNKVGILKAGSMVAEMELPALMEKYKFPLYDIIFQETPGHTDLMKLHDCQWIYETQHHDKVVSVRLAESLTSNKIFGLAESFKSPVKAITQRQRTLEEIFISITSGRNYDGRIIEKRIS